jgi:hypothetical protein
MTLCNALVSRTGEKMNSHLKFNFKLEGGGGGERAGGKSFFPSETSWRVPNKVMKSLSCDENL